MASANRIQLSPDAIALVRSIAERMLDEAAGLFDEVNEALLAFAPAELVADPTLAAEIEQSNAAVLGRWLAEAMRDPGVFVDPVQTPDTLNFARDVARRGLEDMTFNNFRVGLAVASRHVMEAAFASSAERPVIQEALGYMLRSASEYVDQSAAFIHRAIVEERRALASRPRARRLDVVRDVLEGELSDPALASQRLAFELDRPLLAAILWADPSLAVSVDQLEVLAREIAAAAGAGRPLVVDASATSVWAWLPAVELPPRAELGQMVLAREGVRAAFGGAGRGVPGFRASHEEAARAQRVMARLRRPVPVATHDELRVFALAGHDELAALDFARTTLGTLADAPRALRITLRALIAEEFDTVAASQRLGVHRNTVLARLRRIRQLLPPGAPRWVDVALALELDHWLDPGDGDA